ncbi:MAG: hypothetical protein COB78_10835 [Hyphomicrobiales bacterium]|nr:MAG: hypothetical protein COB78_10835 [Hyphomicrobiales bacterium]
MDLSSIVANTRTIQIKHPGTGAEIGLAIDLVSLTDDRVKLVERQNRNKLMRKGMKNVSAEQLDKTADDVLIATMVSWKWAKDATFDGEQLEFNRKNIDRLFAKLPFVRTQIDEELANEADFFQS